MRKEFGCRVCVKAENALARSGKISKLMTSERQFHSDELLLREGPGGGGKEGIWWRLRVFISVFKSEKNLKKLWCIVISLSLSLSFCVDI